MYGIKLYNHVPAPKPAHSDRIVAAHYYPAWKAGATDLHHGFEDLFDFPERTPLCGYYESDDPLYMNFEIKWALGARHQLLYLLLVPQKGKRRKTGDAFRSPAGRKPSQRLPAGGFCSPDALCHHV